MKSKASIDEKGAVREVSPTSPKHREGDREVGSPLTEVFAEHRDQPMVIRQKIANDPNITVVEMAGSRDRIVKTWRKPASPYLRTKIMAGRLPFESVPEYIDRLAKQAPRAVISVGHKKHTLVMENGKVYLKKVPTMTDNSTSAVSPVVRYLAERVAKTYEEKYGADK